MTFLEIIGRKVDSVSELKAGDIIGRITHNYTRLYYVNKVILNPQPPYLLPPIPRAELKAPNIPLTIIDGKVFRWSIYVPPFGIEYTYTWLGSKLDLQDEDLNDYVFDAYLIQDEKYKKLGELIPEVEVPSWEILCQTTNSENKIHDFVNAVKDDIKKSRELFNKIQCESRKYS